MSTCTVSICKNRDTLTCTSMSTKQIFSVFTFYAYTLNTVQCTSTVYCTVYSTLNSPLWSKIIALSDVIVVHFLTKTDILNIPYLPETFTYRKLFREKQQTFMWTSKQIKSMPVLFNNRLVCCTLIIKVNYCTILALTQKYWDFKLIN